MQNRTSLFSVTFLSLVLITGLQASELPKIEESLFVLDPGKTRIDFLDQTKLFSIDHPTREGYELYGPKGTKEWLTQNGIAFSELEAPKHIADYPTFWDLENRLHDIHNRYPTITSLFSIGTTPWGKNLWVMKISAHADQDLPLPEVKYISSMHGDEITGRDLMMMLIEELVTSYGSNPEITSLIDNTEIFIMPSMNPDGTELHQRANAEGHDLNRSFPDFVDDPNNSPINRPHEVHAVMLFQARQRFVLSANFHGGSEVVNYMWETVPELHPQDALLRQIALDYTSHATYIRESREFENGITNGYAWYHVQGGMQDWSNYWYGDVQFTIELSHQKWPRYSEIPGFYQANHDALIGFLKTAHQGAGFVIQDRNTSGTVEVFKQNQNSEIRLGEYSFASGEYYKLLERGSYRFVVKPAGQTNREFRTEVTSEIRAGGNYTQL